MRHPWRLGCGWRFSCVIRGDLNGEPAPTIPAMAICPILPKSRSSRLAARGRSAQTARNLLINRLESTQNFQQQVFCHGLLDNKESEWTRVIPSENLIG